MEKNFAAKLPVIFPSGKSALKMYTVELLGTGKSVLGSDCKKCLDTGSYDVMGLQNGVN